MNYPVTKTRHLNPGVLPSLRETTASGRPGATARMLRFRTLGAVIEFLGG